MVFQLDSRCPFGHFEFLDLFGETYMVIIYRFVVNLLQLIKNDFFLKYTQNTLTRLEKILTESGYIIRFERGSFQSGYCILEDKKVVVLNKFLNPEGKINALMDIIPVIGINYDLLTLQSQKTFDELKSHIDLQE